MAGWLVIASLYKSISVYACMVGTPEAAVVGNLSGNSLTAGGRAIVHLEA